MGEHQCFRVFFAWDFDREEAWINRMSRERGLHLRRVGCCRYVFERGEKGAYIYRLELQNRAAEDAAEKQYLKTVGAEEVCSNGEWSYYRLPAEKGPFASYACAASKLAYLRKLYPFYLIFGAAVYVALAVDLSAFMARPMTAPHALALALLTLLALWFTVGVTRFHRIMKRLKRELNGLDALK